MLNGHFCFFSHNMHVKQYDYISKLSIMMQKLETLKSQKLSISVQWIRKGYSSQKLPVSVQWIGKGYSLWATPLFFCLGMPSCLGLINLVQLWILVVPSLVRWGNEATLTLAALVPLWLSGSIPHQGRQWWIIKKLDTEGCIPISYPNGLATVTQFHEQSWWLSSPLSNGIYGLRHLPLCQMQAIL